MVLLRYRAKNRATNPGKAAVPFAYPAAFSARSSQTTHPPGSADGAPAARSRARASGVPANSSDHSRFGCSPVPENDSETRTVTDRAFGSAAASGAIALSGGAQT